MENFWITDRLPTKEDGRWCKYGGNQVIITGLGNPSEERWVQVNFVEKISKNKIQPWRTPTDEDLKVKLNRIETLMN